MRKKLFSLLVATLPLLSFGQEAYSTFLEKGKVWTFHYLNDFTGREYYQSLTIAGDTIIDGKDYKIIADIATGVSEIFMREKGKRVFCKGLYGEEYLLYDFGLSEGESFLPVGATVVSVDTISVRNHTFRVMDIRPKDMMDYPNIWIEGIGSMQHLVSNFPATGNFFYLYSCKLGDEDLFIWNDEVNAIRELQHTERSKSSSVCYDLQGRRLAAPPAKGIYVKGGRKVVVK